MPSDRSGEPWSDVTYRGFAAPAAEPQSPRRRLPRLSRHRLMIGAAVAVALGLLLGFWARPNLKSGSGAADSDLAAPNRAVPIELQKPSPPMQPKPAGKLEVLPPAEAAAARAQAAPPPAPPAPQTGPQVVSQASASTLPLAPAPTPAPRAVQPPPLAVPPPATPLPATPPRAAYRASFDCASARPGAEQMVCSDPELAAEDRALARAYRRALASGAAPGALRADQRDWMGIREDAARHSRRALAEVYQQRIDELDRAADDGPPPPDDEGPGD